MKTFTALLLGLCTLAAYADVIVVEEAAPKKAKKEMLPVEDNKPFEICILPGLPESQENSNVFGFKLGAPVSYGIGRVYGLEASVLMSGTDIINGGQASIIFCKNRILWGACATYGVVINTEGFEGIVAAPCFGYAGDFHGVMASSVNVSGSGMGLQAGAICNVTRGDFVGFQAAVIANVVKNFEGLQCGLYNQVDELSGVQLGLINRAKKTGVQFGLLNFIKDGSFLPVFPIVNFSF